MERKKLFYVNLFLILFVLLSSVQYGQTIPKEERDALIAIYNACQGDMWIEDSGWKSEPLEFDGFGPIGSEHEWDGVKVADGHVTELIIRDAGAAGPLPPELADLGFLKKLELRTFSYEAQLPPELGALSQLRELYVRGNFTGPIPPELGRLNNLEYLRMDGKFSDPIPPQLGQLSSLVTMIIQGNFNSGIPPEFGNLGNLRVLFVVNTFQSLRNVQFHSSPTPKKKFLKILREKGYIAPLAESINPLPPEIGKLENLESLNLKCGIGGQLPSEIGNLTHLKNLSISGVAIRAPLPIELGNLQSLIVLDISGIIDEGPLPAMYGNLTSLETLRLSRNHLTGPIPPELSLLTKLKNLQLNQNSLTGPIPSELANLRNLKLLALDGNCLTGEVPGSLSTLNLEHCFLSFNSLYTKDDRLRKKLKKGKNDWWEAQTLPPDHVSVTQISESSVRLSWQPVGFLGKKGCFLIYFRTAPNGKWRQIAKTDNNFQQTFDITGLKQGQTYFFAVRTQTEKHPWNPNTLISFLSKEAKIKLK